MKQPAGGEHPTYILYWTHERLLNTFKKSFLGHDDGQFLGPSSTILIELTKPQNTTQQELMVQVFIDD